jgi:hypothetical protein
VTASCSWTAFSRCGAFKRPPNGPPSPIGVTGGCACAGRGTPRGHTWRGTHLLLRAGIGARRRCAGRTTRPAGTTCRPAPRTPRVGQRPHARSSAAHADQGPAEVPAPPAHQTASQPIRFLPRRPNSVLAALPPFAPVATLCQPRTGRGIPLAPVRDQGVAGSNPVSPTN